MTIERIGQDDFPRNFQEIYGIPILAIRIVLITGYIDSIRYDGLIDDRFELLLLIWFNDSLQLLRTNDLQQSSTTKITFSFRKEGKKETSSTFSSCN